MQRANWGRLQENTTTALNQKIYADNISYKSCVTVDEGGGDSDDDGDGNSLFVSLSEVRDLT